MRIAEVLEEVKRLGLSPEDVDQVVRLRLGLKVPLSVMERLRAAGFVTERGELSPLIAEFADRLIMVHVRVNMNRLLHILQGYPLTIYRIIVLGLPRRDRYAVFDPRVGPGPEVWCKQYRPSSDLEAEMCRSLLLLSEELYSLLKELFSKLHSEMFAGMFKSGEYFLPKPTLRVLRGLSSRIRFTYEVSQYEALRFLLCNYCGIRCGEPSPKAEKILSKILGVGLTEISELSGGDLKRLIYNGVRALVNAVI